MTTRDDTPRRRPRTAAQAAMLARLRDKGLGLAPQMVAGRIVGVDRMPADGAAAGAPVADLSPTGPITRLDPARPADRRLGLQPDRDRLDLVCEFEIDLKRLPEWQESRISANDRHHRQAAAKRTKLWRKAGKLATPRFGRQLDWGRVVIFYRFPDNIRRETSNLQPTSKAILDGLVDAGLLPDDRDEHCDGPDNRRLWPNGPHKVVVQVWTRS